MTAFPPLYAIVDTDVCAERRIDPRRLARAYLDGGARLLQLRAKVLDGRAFLALAEAVVADAAAADARVIVNDRADIAVLSGAAGVHVGQDDLEVEAVRRLVGGEAIVGLSTHTPAQLADAMARPVSYVAIGPVYGTVTKETGYAPVGLSMVRAARDAAAATNVPVVAIGGVTLERARDVWRAGAVSIAVITDLLRGDPAERVAAWLAAAAESPR